MEQLAFEKIKEQVSKLEAEGLAIDHKKFLAWLDSLAQDDLGLREYRMMKHEADMAHFQAKSAYRESRYRQKLEAHKTMFEAVMTTAIAALKTSLPVNGGASVAMQGFLAALLKANNQLVIPFEFRNSTIYFSIGVLVAGLASATTYIAQYNFQSKSEKISSIFRYFSIALVFLSYVFFRYRNISIQFRAGLLNN